MYRLRAFLIRIFLTIASLGSLLLSGYFFILAFNCEAEDKNTLYVTCATLLLIASFTLVQFISATLYNNMNDTTKTALNPEGMSLQHIFNVFEEMQTALGRPWMGRIQSIKNKVIIFGPNAYGEYIYIQGFGKTRINISLNDNPSWIIPGKDDEWRLSTGRPLDDPENVIRYKFAMARLLPELTDRVQTVLDGGPADTSPLGMGPDERAYLFMEEFKWTGQDFFLTDADGNDRLLVTSQIPCKSFHFIRNGENTDAFYITKRIFHIFPTYDMYDNGVLFGRIKKRIHLHHTYFSGATTSGKLELRSMNAMFGSNYQVKLDGRYIGTVARSLNIELRNIIFDNYIITTCDESYLPLMAAMGVMAAREAKRDKTEQIAMLAHDD